MNKMCFLCASFTVIFALYNDATAQVQKKKPDSKEKNKIVGTWRLIEYADSNIDTHKWEYPMGKKPQGYFTYTKGGTVNLNICSELPLRTTRKLASAMSVNLESFLRSNSFGYFGTYKTLPNDTIVHHVEGGSIPYYIGEDQARKFTIKNDTVLTIEIWGEHPGKRVLVREK